MSTFHFMKLLRLKDNTSTSDMKTKSYDLALLKAESNLLMSAILNHSLEESYTLLVCLLMIRSHHWMLNTFFHKIDVLNVGYTKFATRDRSI